MEKISLMLAVAGLFSTAAFAQEAPKAKTQPVSKVQPVERTQPAQPVKVAQPVTQPTSSTKAIEPIAVEPTPKVQPVRRRVLKPATEKTAKKTANIPLENK